MHDYHQKGTGVKVSRECESPLEGVKVMSRGVQVLANSQIFAKLYLKFGNLI